MSANLTSTDRLRNCPLEFPRAAHQDRSPISGLGVRVFWGSLQKLAIRRENGLHGSDEVAWFEPLDSNVRSR
jgi:hypothetical protein